MSTIVAIGGYVSKDGNASMLSLPVDKEIVRLTGKRHPRALFIPTATDDSAEYVLWFEKMYGEKLKCKTDTLLLYKEQYTPAQLREKILSADIIFVGGGNTLKMMHRWKRCGVIPLLRQAYKKDTVFAGVSAGSIIWFEYGVSDSRQFKNPKSNEYIRVSTLGFIKGLHCPHFKSRKYDRGHRSRGLRLISKRTPGTAFALTDGCAAIFTGQNYKIFPFAKGGKAYRVSWRKGAYVEEAL